MAILDPIQAKVLAARIIPYVDSDFATHLGLPARQRSIGIFTADNDDATYVSIDEATKMAEVDVIYAHSFYAGSKHASGLLSGEIIAVLAGADPAEVQAGMDAAAQYLQKSAWWYSANQDGSIAFFPHVIAQCGKYLSKTANVPIGTPWRI